MISASFEDGELQLLYSTEAQICVCVFTPALAALFPVREGAGKCLSSTGQLLPYLPSSCLPRVLWEGFEVCWIRGKGVQGTWI